MRWHFHEARALPVVKKASSAPLPEHNVWEYAMHSELTPVFAQRKMRYSYVRLGSGDIVVLLCEKAIVLNGSIEDVCHIFWDITSQRQFAVEVDRIGADASINALFEKVAI
ncbi:MAG: hypothetical protein WC761_00335 [Candidatus Paceibacterota bacterium]|jgi:hypothetical protein